MAELLFGVGFIMFVLLNWFWVCGICLRLYCIYFFRFVFNLLLLRVGFRGV